MEEEAARISWTICDFPLEIGDRCPPIFGVEQFQALFFS
jgi:hypothetical protein